MRRRRHRPAAPVVAGGVVGVALLTLATTGLPVAHSAGLHGLPAVAVGRQALAHPTYSVVPVEGSHTRDVLLRYTAMQVLVTPLGGSPEAARVRIRARADDGTLSPWVTCGGRAGRTWTCTHPPLTSTTAAPTVGEHVALP